MPRALTVRPIALQGQLEQTRYRKRDDGLDYVHDGKADLWLVETAGGRRGTLALPRRGDGWKRDGDTHWLTNSPSTVSRSGMSKRKSSKRRPPGRFKTWSAWSKHMASTRRGGKPLRARSNPGGPKMGRKRAKHRRRNPGTAVARRSAPRRTVIKVLKNAPRHRRRRRNPPLVSTIVNHVKDSVIGAFAVVGGEAAARLTRSRAFGMPAGETMSSLAELGVGTVAGLAIGWGAREHSMRANIACDFTKGAYAGVLRATAKQLGGAYPIVNEALGDSTRKLYRISNGRVLPLNGARAAVNGRLGTYVGGAAPPGSEQLGGYVAGSQRLS